MMKKEIYQNIFEDMVYEGILNLADACNLSFLQEEVEQILGKHLENYAFVYKTAIITD